MKTSVRVITTLIISLSLLVGTRAPVRAGEQPARAPLFPATSLQQMTVDGQGNIYVPQGFAKSAMIKSAILKLSPTGRLVRKIARFGIGRGQVAGPTSVVLDRKGNILVADAFNNRIQKFSPSGRLLAVWGSAGDKPGQFSEPTDMAVDARGNIYVVEYGNHRVQELSPTGRPLSTFGQFQGAWGIAIDHAGDILVADLGAGTVQKYSPSGRFLGTFAVTPNPDTVRLDPSGNVYVTSAESPGIWKFSPEGKLLAAWHKHLRYPWGLAFTAGGRVLVADNGVCPCIGAGPARILTFTLGGKLLATWN